MPIITENLDYLERIRKSLDKKNSQEGAENTPNVNRL